MNDMLTSDHRAAMERASREWKNSLLDVSRSNRLLFFKETTDYLDLSEADQSAVQQLFNGQTVNLRQLFPDPSKYTHAERACKKIAAKQKEAFEEYGVSVTYLALGLASWGEQADTESQDNTGTPETLRIQSKSSKNSTPNAPVFLRSVSVERKKGRSESWMLSLEEDIQINGVLSHVLEAEGVKINEEEVLSWFSTDDPSTDINEGYVAVQAMCSSLQRFRIVPAKIIGTFTYQNQPMINDVSNLDALSASDLVTALAGNREAADRIRSRAQDVSINESDPDYTPLESEFLVLDADASQSYVVNAAVAGRNLVVQGPPGTGKSQTITNVIAALVASGRRVLFVAQKRAAIEAVLDRLDQVGLDHLLLDLFAAKSSRRFVNQQVQASLERQNTVTLPDVTQLHHQLDRNRKRLVAHKDALIDSSHAWGISVSKLRIASADIPPDARIDLRLPASTFQQWTPTTLAELSEDLDSLHRIGALYPGWAQSSPWDSSSLTSNADLKQGLEAIQDLQKILHDTHESRMELASRAGHEVPETWSEVSGLINLHRKKDTFHQEYPLLLQDPDLDALLAAVNRSFRRNHPEIDRKRRILARKRRRSVLTGIPRKLWSAKASEAQDLRDTWRSPEHPLSAQHLSQIEATMTQAEEAFDTLTKYTKQPNLNEASFTTLESTLNELASNQQATEIVRANQLQSKLNVHNLGQVVTWLRNRSPEGHSSSARPSEILRWVTYQSLLRDALLKFPALANFNSEEFALAIDQFHRADKDHFEANAARVRRHAAVNLKAAFDQYPEQHSLLKTEVTRKRYVRSVRKLFEDAPNVLLAAKPVWVMSPLQVSRVLPAEKCFDVVIFDEASQVKPADAVPALMRAEQAIVAGDSRQLPPTEFFSKVVKDDDPEDEIQSISGEPTQKSLRRSYTNDAESILISMDRLLAGQSRSLQWHYRSRDERLIATSNEHIYHRSLTTFPAVDAMEAVKHVIVPYSPGIGTTTNSPELEVKQVIELIKIHTEKYPTESLGVITFGIKHQHRIEHALDEAMRNDPALEAALANNEAEPFFVKAIERVQGDERDAIILSVGYGKGSDGRLRYFWGPVLQEGGERRLNVAISRSKKRMTLVTSFSPDDLAADANPSAGYKLMYHFTRFMASGGEDLKDGDQSSVPLNPFEIDVKTRLEAAGLSLDTQVGVGQYRLDFAIRHPEKPGRHVLAVEADGASYHSGQTARERDRLRQQLLEARGWRFHRIWSSDWFNDAEQEVEKVVQAYNAALASEHSALVSEPLESTTERSWIEEVPQRSLQRPSVGNFSNITEYPDTVLLALLKYIRSDSILRSADEEQLLMMQELGFSRRGVRIKETLDRIQKLLN